MNKEQYQIRNATLEDVSDITELSHHLGYPTLESETKKHLKSILNSDDHAAFVAHISENKVIGWIHVYRRQSIESGFFAEIGGIIVSDAYRGKGIGKRLLESIEQWTLQKNLPKLRVRSQLQREDAKKFYSKMGFTVTKRQRVFDKKIRKEA